MKLQRYNGNFVECLAQIKKAKQRTATGRQGMLDRIKQGPDSDYKEKGCWYPEGTARVDGINYWCLEEFAPTTNYPQETLTANQSGNYLDITQPQIIHPASKRQFLQLIPEIAEADKGKKPYNRRVLVPENQETFSHDSAHLDEVDIVLFTARSKKLAKSYGNFLKNKCGINSVTFYQIGKDYNNVAAGFWLRRFEPGGGSGFGGGISRFDYVVGSLFGVAKRGALSRGKSSAEPTQKILVYQPEDLEILQGVAKGEIANNTLERIIQRFL